MNAPERIESKALSASDILNADDLPIERVELPAWGGHVYIRTLTGKERDFYEMSCLTGKDSMQNMRAKLVALTACTEDRKPIFTPEQIKELGKKSCVELDRCFEVAQRINRLRAEDVEGLIKNFIGDQNGSIGIA